MKKAGELLSSFFDQKMITMAKGYNDFFGNWSDIVGERLAAHTKVSEIEGTTLVVEADHPGWIQIFQMKQNDVLRIIQHRYPSFDISAIAIKLSKNKNDSIDVTSESLKKIRQDVKKRTDQEIPESPVVYDSIGDEDFREKLKRLEESIKRKNGEGHD